MLARPSAEMCRGFLLYKNWRFCRGFSWRIFLGTFSHKNEEKNPARKSAKKSGGQKKKKSVKNPFCQNPTLIDGQNRQSPIATRSTLADHSAVPRGTNVERVNDERPREPFSRLFSNFGPKDPNDPCKWSTIS